MKKNQPCGGRALQARGNCKCKIFEAAKIIVNTMKNYKKKKSRNEGKWKRENRRKL